MSGPRGPTERWGAEFGPADPAGCAPGSGADRGDIKYGSSRVCYRPGYNGGRVRGGGAGAVG